MQRLNYGGQESKNKFAVYDYDTPVTFKQGQGHQSWYEFVDPKQGYNLLKAKFEKSHLNSVCQKANDKVFVKSGTMSIISPEYMWKSKLVVYS